jgi:hypothetical protein
MMGVGAGASFVPLLQIGMSEIPNADAGLGSGIVNVSQQLAGAIGLAALGTIAENRSKSLVAAGHNVINALADSYRLALLIAAACVIVAILLAPIVLRAKESPEEQRAHITENMANPEAMEHLVL